jgi:hypothetical protein
VCVCVCMCVCMRVCAPSFVASLCLYAFSRTLDAARFGAPEVFMAKQHFVYQNKHASRTVI